MQQQIVVISRMVNFIKQIRKERGLSSEALAEKVGTSAQQINHLENGKRKLSWDWIQKLAKALECHPLEITEGPGTVKPLDEREKEFINMYRGMNEDARNMVEDVLRGIADRSGGDNKPPAKNKPQK
ncbi:MAG: helix-turn-helix transcriptional regulator [bacterium]|nr:helix-turn-helix transcriptional regulator [bacterium]